MIRPRLIGSVFAALLVAGLPATAVSQSAPPSSPEGFDWTLTSYYDEATAETTAVPFEIGATLRLEEGVASGFAGCNQFSGNYLLDGSSLSLGEEMSVTLALCDEPAQTVEDAYLAALGEVDGWTIDAGMLELSDDFGDVVLTFERASILWTPSQLASLMTALTEMQGSLDELRTDVDALRDDVAAVPVERFRDRIKALESDNRKLKESLKAVGKTPKLDPAPRPDPTPKGDARAYTSAETALLRGIPTRIANRCQPLRSALPRGTQAAVTCRPNTDAVAKVDYYLMEGEAAATAFGADMDAHNVTEATSTKKTCEQGVKSQRHRLDNGWQAEGCYRANDLAEVRFIDNATDCRKLKVGGKNLASPTFYITLRGTNRDITRVHDWATKNLPADSAALTSIIQPIPSKGGVSPYCPT